MNGPTLFARFAYPPNERGLCGPDDHAALLGYASTGDVDRGLSELARRFDGAWPYLQLIAGACSCADPLDPLVVEGYWIGTHLTDRAAGHLLAHEVVDRFRPRVGRHLDQVVDAVRAGLRPTHSFHVFGVYPWVGLLRSGRAEPAVSVLDQCRVRWGTVREVDGDLAVVTSRRLTASLDGRGVELGPAVTETARLARGGEVLAGAVAPGDEVALHWDWVCTAITPGQRRHLASDLAACLSFVNAANPPAAPGARSRRPAALG
jgi:hypothetical protein